MYTNEMNPKEFLALSDTIIENYSEYLNGDIDIITLSMEEYSHLVKMLLSEIEHNKKSMYDKDTTYADFAKENVVELTDYLAWITFLTANARYTATECQVTIPQKLSKKLFLHLLAFDAGSAYVI